ncbi:SAM-dependent methyltransferase [Maritimibacter sp. 55A14]|uniref:DUF938 domain-containing protein n=1 Tax=Maritimibacter sp. 55A14 TaxID=2174844 RepID=UPI000D613C49|nr:DUF938 domain-containing protein [Maritimibacter sp. 55A14]PWE34398.1 SAM-dependent methyltransferase [Maritimibacter sp. 55A14]
MNRPPSAQAPKYDAVAEDGRISAPTYDRNIAPLTEALAPWLEGRTGRALEIGSGPGQHVTALARSFPSLSWTGSDPDPAHLRSIAAWTAHLGVPVAPPLALDAATEWAARPDIAAIAPLELILNLNVIHITPMEVARGILRGAGQCLAPGGLLAFYGPFRENGAHTGEGNARFDEGLRARNPDWGIRDAGEIAELGAAEGLEHTALIPMPANNRILLLRRG